MTKTKAAMAVLLIVLIGGALWLLRGADAKHLDRQDIVVDIPDTFEK